jgi:hypothetical protein
MRQIHLGSCLALLFLSALTPSIAWADPAPPSKEGPSISYSQNSFGLEERSFNVTPKGLRSSVATTTVRAAYPIALGSYMVVPLIVGIEDTRKIISNDPKAVQIMAEHSRVIAPSLIFVANTGVDGFHSFVKVGQYQAMRTPEPAGIMRELVAGLSWVEPGSEKDSPLTAKLAGRHREFSYGQRTLLVGGLEKWWGHLNMGLDIQYPSHALFKFNFVNVGLLATGFESDGIQMPMRLNGQPVWAEGYHARVIASWTRQIWSAVHAELKGGADEQKIAIYDHNGRTVEKIIVQPALFTSLAIRSLF